jgi:adenylate cyclase class 2
MRTPKEVEIKFVIADMQELEQKLTALGFRRVTPQTHELNTLYDLPGQKLRRKGELLRLRKYGEAWRLTHKTRGVTGRHKLRAELETSIGTGAQMDAILRALGYRPVFEYEKYRSEWSDGKGHVVLDHTPIGDIAEIEGRPKWIDRTARALGVATAQYVTKSYAELFFDWKRRYRQKALNMTFRECGGRAKSAGQSLVSARVPRKPKPAPEFRPRRA